MNRPFRIAFVGNYQYNCGSSNTLLGYVKAGKALNWDIKVSEFGYIDRNIRKIVPVADKNWKPDLLVMVYESYPFLSSENIDEICTLIPRSKRILVDPDGKYSEPCVVGKDTNHENSDSYNYWTSLYDSLSDSILQPCVYKKPKTKKNLYPFLYFGIDNKLPDFSRTPKKYDLLYLGNNWYRWHDIKWLVKTIKPIRSQIKRVALMGDYWSKEIMEEFKDATFSEPDLLRKNNIKIVNSAPYGQVEKTMSTGFLNPIFIRPILCKLGFATPRMFETIMADTTPLIPSYFRYADLLYGDLIEHFKLTNKNSTEDIKKIFREYKKNTKLIWKIRNSLKVRHSYQVRLKELLNYV